MNTQFKRFKMLALQTMAGEGLKNDANNATSCFWRILMTYFVSVGSYNGNQNCVEHLIVETAINFCQTTPYLSLLSDFVRLSVVLGVVLQLSKLWRNDSRSTCKQNAFIWPNCD